MKKKLLIQTHLYIGKHNPDLLEPSYAVFPAEPKHDSIQNTAIILLTAMAVRDDRRPDMEFCPADYMTKLFGPTEFFNAEYVRLKEMASLKAALLVWIDGLCSLMRMTSGAVELTPPHRN